MKVRLADTIRRHPRLRKLLWLGKFGLETERLRVDSAGHLAQTPHPSSLGRKADHPYITTDFAESQVEMVTPPMNSLEEAHGFIKTLLNVVREELPPGELLWPQSMPGILPADDQIPLARFDGSASGRTEYREHLSKIYGRARQTICGSHFNISFLPEFFLLLAAETGKPVDALKEEIYLRVVRNLMRHRWFLVGLLGRSPISHESLRLKALRPDDLMQVCCDFGSSIRCSQIGYRNPQPLLTDYRNIDGYLDDLSAHIGSGKLLNPNELYLPVRIKTSPGETAVSHLEIRVMDIDPFDSTGISPDSLRLLHLFSVFCLLQEESGPFDSQQQGLADARQNQVACWGFTGSGVCGDSAAPEAPLQTQARALLDEIEHQLDTRENWPPAYAAAWSTCRTWIDDWESHPAAALKREIAAQGFIGYHLERARQQAEELAPDAYKFLAYPDLELSTQLLLKAAVRRGINIELLDRTQNFIRLSKGSKQEYVVQATKTSLDRYSSILAMENKKVTKLVLAEHGIATPGGHDFASPTEAKLSWGLFQKQAIVVKPISTNFGLGITILKENRDPRAFERAVEIAFAEDTQILIEPFIPGKEFRFFLIDDQVVAILHRVPANVVGDGCLTIRQLVALKNQDPLRGVGYVTPLERIRLGEAEEIHLRIQGLDFDSIPVPGATVFLRENSNISTGGDSIDYTDRAHPSYTRIASAAANALGVKITGLDMMVQDIEAPATPDNHAIIEMNFNPAIHIHCHPYHGTNRKLDERILSALGFV